MAHMMNVQMVSTAAHAPNEEIQSASSNRSRRTWISDISEEHDNVTLLPASAEEEEGAGQGAGKEHETTCRTYTVLYLICAIEGVDMSLLAGSVKALESEMGFTPTAVGSLAMGQSLALVMAGLVWGSLADRGLSRKMLLARACVAWGIITLILAALQDFWSMFLLRCVNGIALGALSPVSQSLLADWVPHDRRGKVFGFVQLCINSGSALSALVVTTVSQVHVHVLGEEVLGWRIAWGATGLLSLLLGLCAGALMEEDPRSNRTEEGFDNTNGVSERGAWGIVANSAAEVWRDAKHMWEFFRIQSFAVIVVQGMFGCIPWASMGFLILWYQYTGESDLKAGALGLIVGVCCGMGALIGGALADYLTRTWSRFHGRPLTAQVSVLSGIVIIIIILRSHEAPYEAIVLLGSLFGLTASWAGTACNTPLFMEIVAESSRARIVAFCGALNGAAASVLGGPLVGVIAETLGYRTPEIGQSIWDLTVEQRRKNLEALTQAITIGTVAPWCVCMIAFSALHCTYKHDVEDFQARERRQGKRAVAAEGGFKCLRAPLCSPGMTSS